MKKIKIVAIYISEKTTMGRVANSLTKGINEECPDGYHYKGIVMNDIRYTDDYDEYFGDVLVAFEED